MALLKPLLMLWTVVATMFMASAHGSRHRLLHRLSTFPPAVNATDEFLIVHNKARVDVQVPLLRWSTMLAAEASLLARSQRDKKGCSFADVRASKYGVNQAWIGGRARVKEAVELWVEKKKYYNRAKNVCALREGCGVYLQVVWRKSVEVGCAQVVCGKGTSTLAICLYNPPGNVIGEIPY